MDSSDSSKRRLLQLSSSDGSGENIRTFIFKGEGHTLGNALRHVILKNPQVSFCGYSIPHPAEDEMFLRIQTVEGVAAQDALKKGLEDLKEICQITRNKFKKEMNEFSKRN